MATINVAVVADELTMNEGMAGVCMVWCGGCGGCDNWMVFFSFSSTLDCLA